MLTRSKYPLFIVYIITICLGWSLALKNEKLKSNSGILERVLPNDTEIMISGADFDSSDQDFIEALQKNRTSSQNPNTINAVKFLSSLKLKKYRRTHRQNRFPAKHHSHDAHSHKTKKSELVLAKARLNLGTDTSSRIDDIPKLNRNMHADIDTDEQKKEPGLGSESRQSADPDIGTDKQKKDTGLADASHQSADPDVGTDKQKKDTGLADASHQSVDPDFSANKQKKESGFDKKLHKSVDPDFSRKKQKKETEFGYKFSQNVDPNFNANKQKKETGRSPHHASDRKESSNIESPLQIVDSWFQHMQPGDVVLLFHLIIMHTGKETLKVLTTHNCCFTMPKLEQEGDANGKDSEEEAENCHSMALIGQREYSLVPNESRNVTLLFASTQLLIYQYQRKGYCEIEFISEGTSGSILASSTIQFDTAIGRVHEKEVKTEKYPTNHLSTTHLEIKDGIYTGNLCEDQKCIPVDCIQEFGGGANRFSVYRGKCMSTPYCDPNGLLFYDKRWNRCRNITDLRLDPISDLDEVPQVVKRGKSPLATAMKKLLPGQDLKSLSHMQCDQLQNAAERTWGKNFLCQNLPLICQRCSIK